ncbi:MAG: nucleoside:proton symporter [Gammaproteobacteria bacterium]|nr:nucleoside:proton symporter [Gammaproteobacteria bacterium]
MQAIFGIAVLLGLAWLLSENRGRFDWRVLVSALTMQVALAAVLLKAPVLSEMLLSVNGLVRAVEQATQVGTGFVFGYLGGGPAPFEVNVESALYLFSFRVLPQILVFSALVAILWHWRVLPVIIRAFGAALRRTLGVGGAVGTAAAASLFLGMAEAPLVIRAYLAKLTRSELFSVMTCGMATIAGSIMVLYAGVLQEVIDGALGHILVASAINVIGAILISRLMIPVAGATAADEAPVSLSYAGTMDAITRGTADGLRLALYIGAMLIVLVSLVALVNLILSNVQIGGAALTLERAMGWAFAPVAWLIGVPWAEAQTAGSLLGTKLVLNELVAYLQLTALGPAELSGHSRLILTYALCGFTNFGSLGILIGGLSTLVPERRSDFLELGSKTLISGTLVSCLTGAIIGLVARL